MQQEKFPAQSMLTAEREKREAGLELLEHTEGFLNLTKRQQRLIRQSLYIQARAERGMDPASAEAISEAVVRNESTSNIANEEHLKYFHEKGELLDPDSRKYKNSQNHIAEWYCHAAIASLEDETSLDNPYNPVEPEHLPENFFRGEYREIESFEELKSFCAEFGFPAVLHIGGTGSHAIHSSLILGHNGEGHIIIWEKKDTGLPYRLDSLENLYSAYRDVRFWGLRKLVTNNPIAA